VVSDAALTQAGAGAARPADATTGRPVADSFLDAPRASVEERLGTRLEDRRPVFAAGVILVAGYVALAAVLSGVGALLVHVLATGRGWDEAVNRWLADHRMAWLNHLTAAGTFFADTVPVIGVLVVASGACVLARRWREPLLLVSALVLEFLVFLTVNSLIGRARPNVVRLDSTPSTASYPSGHIAAIIVVWGGLAIIVVACTHLRGLRAVACTIAFVLAVFVGFARVYRGMHHPTDVFAGALLGVGALTVALVAVRVTGVVVDRADDGDEELDSRPVAR
jgi:undecaprenyl-diphosphatase